MYHPLVTDVELTVEAVALYFEVELSKNPLVSFCPERGTKQQSQRQTRDRSLVAEGRLVSIKRLIRCSQTFTP